MAALALAIDAVVQAEDTKDVFVKLAGKIPGELHLKFGDVSGRRSINFEIRHVGAFLCSWVRNLTRSVRNLA
jgi:hypothetical protein